MFVNKNMARDVEPMRWVTGKVFVATISTPALTHRPLTYCPMRLWSARRVFNSCPPFRMVLKTICHCYQGGEGDKGTSRKEEKNNLGFNSLSVSRGDSEDSAITVYSEYLPKCIYAIRQTLEFPSASSPHLAYTRRFA